eukprot:2186603-Rhodomonas_salina.1
MDPHLDMNPKQPIYHPQHDPFSDLDPPVYKKAKVTKVRSHNGHPLDGADSWFGIQGNESKLWAAWLGAILTWIVDRVLSWRDSAARRQRRPLPEPEPTDGSGVAARPVLEPGPARVQEVQGAASGRDCVGQGGGRAGRRAREEAQAGQGQGCRGPCRLCSTMVFVVLMVGAGGGGGGNGGGVSGGAGGGGAGSECVFGRAEKRVMQHLAEEHEEGEEEEDSNDKEYVHPDPDYKPPFYEDYYPGKLGPMGESKRIPEDHPKGHKMCRSEARALPCMPEVCRNVRD